MITVENDELLTLAQAAKLFPGKGNKRTHPSTLWRWATTGVDGTRLEYVKAGRRIYTTKEALTRFVQELTGPQEVEHREANDSAYVELDRHRV